MLPSQMPIQRTSECSAWRKATLVAATHIRFGDYLQQRVPARFRSMPERPWRPLQRLAGIFLQVCAGQLHGLLHATELKPDRTSDTMGSSYWLIW